MTAVEQKSVRVQDKEPVVKGPLVTASYWEFGSHILAVRMIRNIFQYATVLIESKQQYGKEYLEQIKKKNSFQTEKQHHVMVHL